MAYTTIDKPDEYFNTVIYTGTSAENAITGVNFQPDFTWIKGRSNAYDHRLVDSVRGATKELYSDLSNAEATDAQGLKSFNSDGFTLGTTAAVNNSGATFVAWNWLAANGTASNTDGSITSTVSANTTAGFSIVSYTGTASAKTVGHGLGTTPSMIIVKNLDAAENWGVWHNLLDADEYLGLNQTNAIAVNAAIWNSTLPTSTVFSVGNNARTGSSADFIAYCFAEKKGFSKFGSYTGNGSTDGTFVYTGFKPAFVMIKQSSGSGTSWNMWDNKRLGYNTKNYQLEANTDVVENTALERLLITSNGFKCLTDNAQINGSGATYIYMTFAENPFVTSTGIPACAR